MHGAYALHKAGGYPQMYPVLLTHVGTTVTVVSDPFNVIAAATHNTTGIIDIDFNDKVVTGDSEGPIVVGNSISNIVVHIIPVDADSIQVNTKLNSTGANFTATGNIYLMVAAFDGK